jgi:hypothetical protein
MVKNKFKHFLSKDKGDIAEHLQRKMNYFYGPYEVSNEQGVPISVKYSEEESDKVSEFSEISKKNWKSISNVLCNPKSEDFNKLLKSVNGKLHLQLREIQRNAEIEKVQKGITNKSLGINLFKKAIMSKIDPSRPSVCIPSQPKKHKIRLISGHNRRTSSDVQHFSRDKMPLKEAFDPKCIQNTYRKLKRRGSMDYPVSSFSIGKRMISKNISPF